MIQIDVGFVRRARRDRRRAARVTVRALCACLCAVLLCHCGASGGGVHHDVISHGQFTAVRIYRPAAAAARVVFLLSGDGGWSSGLDEIAARLRREDALVAGIDVRDWLATLEHSATSCAAPGAYLAELARYLQTRYEVKGQPALLIGHSAGATLAYVALVQGRTGDFAGALTLSFCADLDLTRPLCPAPSLREAPRSGGVRLLPGGPLPAPWIGLHGLDDRECPAAEARRFATAIPNAQFLPLPGEGHSYADLDPWWGSFIAAYRQLTVPAGKTGP
jgi:type IV secretory pathway VirJ component